MALVHNKNIYTGLCEAYLIMIVYLFHEKNMPFFIFYKINFVIVFPFWKIVYFLVIFIRINFFKLFNKKLFCIERIISIILGVKVSTFFILNIILGFQSYNKFIRCYKVFKIKLSSIKQNFIANFVFIES